MKQVITQNSERVGETLVVLLCIFFVCIPNVLCSAADEEGEATGRKPTLIVGYSSKLFFDVDTNDAEAATKVWTGMLVKKMGSFGSSETVIFPDLSSVEKSLKEKSVDIVVLFSQELVEIRNKVHLEPVFAADYGRNFYHDQLLIVRADSGLSNLGDLKGKSLVIEIGQKGTLPMLWLETLLLREGVQKAQAYFSTTREAARAAQVILPVFFGKADACVVGRFSFETMVELNPQVGKVLKVIARSPGFLSGVVCMRKDFYDKYKDTLETTLKAFSTEPQGKQIMTLFKINRLVPYKPEYLETVESLLREHLDLTTRVARRR
jgi:ABC-type phosphate/phosphonate transport system substrate-binding protein